MAYSEIPKVTGISPKEGSPGTKIIIRGENLGISQEDIIGLTICGGDCLTYAEWKSSKKIITRCTSQDFGKKGEVIVTTLSGGKGTCTVYFRVLSTSICPTEESAIWIDESHMFNNSVGRKRSTSPSHLHPDDPLRLSNEANVGQFPEEELLDLFPDGSGNLMADNFVPAWYLLENHHGTSFDDLEKGLACLRQKVNQHKEGPLSFLKANVMSIVDTLDVLGSLPSALHADKEAIGGDFTKSIEESVCNSKEEADSLFQEMLTRKDKADSTRNALGALQRFRFLFNLPTNIEKNIQKGDYDIVINDYARAKSLFHDTEVAVFRKVYQEVEQKIKIFQDMLQEKLRTLPSSVEEQKKLIRYLINLEVAGDPAWDTIRHIEKWLLNLMESCKNRYQNQVSIIENQDLNNDGDSPQVVKFVVEVTELFTEHFPNFWKLGNAYLVGQLHGKEMSDKTENGSATKAASFKEMVINVNSQLCGLIRGTLLPSSLHYIPFHQQMASKGEALGPWLPHCIRAIRGSYSTLLKLDVSNDVLNTVQQLIFDLRVFSMTTLFTQATEDIKQLNLCENWIVEIDDRDGGRTQLPLLYENRVVETLQLVRETVIHSGPKEMEVFSQINVQGTIKQLSQGLLQAFSQTLEKMAFSPEPMSSSVKNNMQNILNEDAPEVPPQNIRLLIILSNCSYTAKIVIPRLQESFSKHGYPDMSLPIKCAQATFHNVETKLFRAYLDNKCQLLVKDMHSCMKADGLLVDFSSTNCPKPAGVSLYVKETIMQIIEVHAEVFALSPPVVGKVMTEVIATVVEELSKLYKSIGSFSSNGNAQVTVDIRALEEAVTFYKNNSAKQSFYICRSQLKSVTGSKDQELVEDLLRKFRNQFRMQLLCFKEDTIVSV